MSQFQNIARRLVAAGSADAMDGHSTHFLYTQGSSLISKDWNGKSFAVMTTNVADSVRSNSTAAYVLTPSTKVIIYIDTFSKLRSTRFDDDSDEWFEDLNNIPHTVHQTGNVAACFNDRNQIIVLFHGESGDLTSFDLTCPDQSTRVPVRASTNSPLWADFVEGTLHVFYVSAGDQCVHYVIEDGRWTDTAWSLYPFEGTAKRLIVEPKKMGSTLEFEAYILTVQGALLHVAANGNWERLGRVDKEGKFISERNVDICCLEAQNNTLTEEYLKVLLAADPSVIDAVGGPLSVTPLAAACWSGSLEAVRLLLDNPYRLADPNALSPHNRTPLYYAVSRCPPAHRREIVNALLDARARIDDAFTEDNFNTPLMHAVADTGDKDVMHELVDRGTSLTKKNGQGQTVVTLTEGTGLELEYAGARLDDTFAEDNFNAPLMNAVADTGDKDVLHELADHGASLTKKNGQGQTVVMLAEGAGLERELQPSRERQRETGPPQKNHTNTSPPSQKEIPTEKGLADRLATLVSKPFQKVRGHLKGRPKKKITH